MPKIEVIRKEFVLQIECRGVVQLAHFNCRYFYINLDDEYDHTTMWTKGKIYVEGRLMRFQLWTPTFKPNEESTLVPVWVILPKLPWIVIVWK